MKFSLKQLAAWTAAPGLGLLLTSCVPFQAREVEVVSSSVQESKNYYLFTAGGGEKLSFESRNYLSSNLLMDDFFSDSSI